MQEIVAICNWAENWCMCSQRKKGFLLVSKKKCAQVAEMRGDIEELERRRTAEHREVAHMYMILLMKLLR